MATRGTDPADPSALGDAAVLRVVEAMRSPDFYPDRPGAVAVVETHISWVFLAGDCAYKLRKPVVFPFLDYGSRERRRSFCEEEIRLGRRLAPDIYVGVRSVVERGARLELAGPGVEGALEHVTAMRRFDERCTLAALLAGNRATAGHVRRLARRVAAFHATAEPAPPGTFDSVAVAATIGENASTLLRHADVVGPARLAAAHRFAIAFAHGRRALLDARSTDGHVRDGHGDLRVEHVIVGDEVQVFDPVEFDPALRQVDVLADLAFLMMDLVAADREDLAVLLAAEYQAAAGDDSPDDLLWFYASYRAWVRAKVACLRADEMEPGPDRDGQLATARELAELGGRLAWRARRPLTLIVCGASATGKTHLSRALAEASGLPHVNSDVVRKELAGLAAHERADEREYSEEASLRTYRELGARAAAASSGAIVDATFRRRADRAAFAEAYAEREDARAPLFVECRAPAATVADRARARAADPSRASDATPAVAARMLHQLDPLDEVTPQSQDAPRTDQPGRSAIDDLEAFLDGRLARWPRLSGDVPAASPTPTRCPCS
ncbi:MAG: AAA family ATPase [Thermoleophilaceae bacterium]